MNALRVTGASFPHYYATPDDCQGKSLSGPQPGKKGIKYKEAAASGYFGEIKGGTTSDDRIDCFYCLVQAFRVPDVEYLRFRHDPLNQAGKYLAGADLDIGVYS